MRRTFLFPLLAVFLLGALAAPVVPRQQAGASMYAVDSWVTLGSSAPAVGCAIPVTVEIRSGGDTLAGVDILAGLVIDGEIFGSDRAVTGSDGLAYLSIDSASAYAGGNASIEVNLAGTFVGRVAVTLTEGGGCESAPSLFEAAAEIWWDATAAQAAIDEAASAPAEAASAPAEAAAPAEEAGGASIWVPEYFQQRNLSCEYASLTIATGAFGNAISEYSFDGYVGWASDPHVGYRGDINGWWGNTTDYGVYAEPLSWALPQFGFTGEVLYAQGDSSVLTTRLDWGMPTLVWLGLWGDTGFYETGADGSSYLLVPGGHVVVAYGYDAGGVYVSDPAVGYRYFDWSTFMSMWNVFDGMGLAVAPAYRPLSQP